ncbi:unnamed protein product [Pleuronectes platessa]|uniref:Uncharacterized protein n=1 Tax=Pleuronectes platessa TaxID=8262 RepID=A0A9N7TVY9_PLEPL|nr:unnamed protein product [Pleuronectes platessa]
MEVDRQKTPGNKRNMEQQQPQSSHGKPHCDNRHPAERTKSQGSAPTGLMDCLFGREICHSSGESAHTEQSWVQFRRIALAVMGLIIIPLKEGLSPSDPNMKTHPLWTRRTHLQVWGCFQKVYGDSTCGSTLKSVQRSKHF